MISKASVKYLKGSAQKARLVADMIRGKSVEEAVSTLRFCKRAAAREIEKLLHSAIANAEQNPDLRDVDNLYISHIAVDQGPSMKRIRPRAMGRAFRIIHRSSHVTIHLDERLEQEA